MADRSTSDRSLLRIAAVAIPVGLVLQILMETLHPSKADPNDSAAAFQEYAASSTWTIVHIGQFFAALLVALALVALARSLTREGAVHRRAGGDRRSHRNPGRGDLRGPNGCRRRRPEGHGRHLEQRHPGGRQGQRLPSGGGDPFARERPSADSSTSPTEPHSWSWAWPSRSDTATPVGSAGSARRPGLGFLTGGVVTAYTGFSAGWHRPPRTGRPRRGLPARCSGVHVAQEQHRAIGRPRQPPGLPQRRVVPRKTVNRVMIIMARFITGLPRVPHSSQVESHGTTLCLTRAIMRCSGVGI